MTEQSIVERVAAAIDAAEMKWKAENGGDDASCIDCPDEVKARAAIEAMREPTREMMLAAWKSDEGTATGDYSQFPSSYEIQGGGAAFILEYDNKGPGVLEAAYRAAIAAALSEPEAKG